MQTSIFTTSCIPDYAVFIDFESKEYDNDNDNDIYYQKYTSIELKRVYILYIIQVETKYVAMDDYDADYWKVNLNIEVKF